MLFRSINKNKKFNKLNCHSLQIVYRVNNNINLSTFLIRILDENNNKVGRINNSCKVSFKFKDNDKEEFLCDEECQNVMISITDEIKDFIKSYKCKPDLFLKDDKPKPVNLLDSSTDILKDDKPIPFNLLDLSTDILNIIGDFVKKDNKIREREELMDEEQIINEKNHISYFFWC